MSDSWTPPIDPAAGTVTRPREVDLAFWIVVVWTVVDVISAVVSFSSGGAGAAAMEQQMAETQRQLAASGVQMDPDTMSVITNATSIGAIVGAVIGVAVWLFFGLKMRQGRNWARIVITVFAAIAILTDLYGVVAGPTQIISALGLVAYGAVIVLMYRPAANTYFQLH